MKLDELIIQQKSYAELKNLWLVFDAQFLPILNNAQINNSSHKVSAIRLNDGRYFLPADLLSEINGGYFTEAFQQLDPSLFPNVIVLTTEEIQPLLVIYEEND